MLAQLTITDFAIIESLSVTFSEGSNILSGETGAGKSIIINAVNLIVGGRASPDLIRTGSDKAVVEALFHVPEGSPLAGLLAEMDIPFNGEVLIKRTISKEGKSQVRINGSLATLHMLSKLGPNLISVSGQNEHQLLLSPDNHLYVLDNFGELTRDRLMFGTVYRDYYTLKERIEKLRDLLKREEEQRELTQFQIREIEDAKLVTGEDRELEEERRRLVHAESLREIVFKGFHTLYEKDDSILSTLSMLTKEMDRGTSMDPNLEQFRQGLESVQAQVEDLGLELRNLYSRLKVDPRRLEQVEERLELIRRLKKKYGSTIEEILSYKEDLSQRSYQLAQKQEELNKGEVELEEKWAKLVTLAVRLSEKRHEVAKDLENKVEEELNQLGMSGTKFKIEFSSEAPPDGAVSLDLTESAVGPGGIDSVEFLIAPNVGEDLRPMARIASGGELSRIMLALKTILARSSSVETLVFDEIDSGIAGATAAIIGEKLRSLAKYHQIVCITHLPQIASSGELHFLVAKKVSEGRTRTHITPLGSEERINEIARLLGGKTISEKTLAHAREMLSS
ncbi:MAG: DNA repair protein RecN [Deltaproteobacteria bacterium]|nr:MAG: DNA repair protein RecN [Deltaproteobacteria bacterium]